MYSGLLCGGIGTGTGPHSLPLVRIKKIMKRLASAAAVSDEVRMISGEAPIVFSEACELFIEELTRRAWAVMVRGKRRILRKDDVAAAVAATDIFDFLVELVSTSNVDGGLQVTS